MAAGVRLHKTIDAERIVLMGMENKKWRDILHCLFDITWFLGEQNVAFSGHKQDESSLNRENFFGIVEMLCKYIPMLKEHLMRLNIQT